MNIRSTLCSSLAFCAVQTGALAVTITVDDDGPAAFSSIQDAINASMDGDEVVVMPGTYTETLSTLGKAITIRSSTPDDPLVVLQTVLEYLPGSERILTINSGEGRDTIIDGLVFQNADAATSGGAIRNDSNVSPTIRRCVFIRNEASESGGAIAIFNSDPLIESCSFAENSADDGGAVYNFNSSAEIVDSFFARNGVVAGEGGAVHNTAGSLVAITDCVFDENLTRFGSAIFTGLNASTTATGCEFRSPSQDSADSVRTDAATVEVRDSSFLGRATIYSDTATASIIGCTFDRQTALSSRSPVFGAQSDIIIETSDFIGNGTGATRGVMLTESTARVTSCTFTGGNTSLRFERSEITIEESDWFETLSSISIEDSVAVVESCTFVDAGAISASTDFPNITTQLRVTDSAFSAVNALNIRGITTANNTEIDLTVEGSTFTDLRQGIDHRSDGRLVVRGSGFYGNGTTNGGSTTGAAIADFGDVGALIEGCEFIGNFAQNAGAVALGGSGTIGQPLTVSNCLFTDNRSTDAVVAALQVGSNEARILNCTFTGNLGGNSRAVRQISSGNLVVANTIFWDNGGAEFVPSPTGTHEVRNSIVDGGYPGVGIIDADPRFQSPVSGNFELQPNSPAINMGDNADVTVDQLTDIADLDRIVDGTVDIGAYEFQGTGDCFGDCDGSGTVDFGDLVSMLFTFGTSTPLCDANESGTVDFADLVSALFLFGPCP